MANTHTEPPQEEIYAYCRKVVGGFDYGASNRPALYNHSCVVSKKKLNKRECASLSSIQNQIKDFGESFLPAGLTERTRK